MRLVIFKDGNGNFAINPDMVTLIRPHFTRPDATVVAFAGDENDYAVVEEPWCSVLAKLTAR